MLSKQAIPRNIVEQLKRICGEEGVSYTEQDRISYARDCSTSSLLLIHDHVVPTPPDVVVWPRNTQEVSRVLKLAHEKHIPLVPYGAGSGVCGAAIPLKAGIVLDLKKLDQILKIDSATLTARIQCGIIGEILERKLQYAGYTLGHFPSSIYSATLGGYLACRSAGQLSTKYGKIEDMVRSFTVCLPDGRIVEVNDATTNLLDLWVGSEGTLGIITEATLAIHPKAEEERYAGVQFPSVQAGLLAIRSFMQSGLRPAIVRLYDPLDSLMFSSHGGGEKHKKDWPLVSAIKPLVKQIKIGAIRAILSQSKWANYLIDTSLSKTLLILGFEGAAWKVGAEVREVLEICEAKQGKYLGEEPGKQWVKRRYAMGYKLSPLIEDDCFADTMEVAAPWNKLEGLYAAVRKAISPHALVMAHFSHVYADGGSIYFTFAGHSSNTEKNLKLHRLIWDKALEACLEAGGTTSHHHGVGFLKAKSFVRELGPLHTWLRKSKEVFDPHGILNPGKLGL